MGAESEKRVVYIFDTSAFLALYRQHTQVFELPKAVWNKLSAMMTDGSVISHSFVYAEVVNEKAENPDMITQWLIPRKNAFMKDSFDEALLVSDIIDKFPKLIDPNSEKEQADPWIIAQAILLGKQTDLFSEIEYKIVTQEKKTSSKKIPAACKAYKLESLNLKDFFDEIGMTLNVSTE